MISTLTFIDSNLQNWFVRMAVSTSHIKDPPFPYFCCYVPGWQLYSQPLAPVAGLLYYTSLPFYSAPIPCNACPCPSTLAPILHIFRRKREHNVVQLVWDFACWHVAQYILIRQSIDCKQTWCWKIYCINRASWLNPLMKYLGHHPNQCSILGIPTINVTANYIKLFYIL